MKITSIVDIVGGVLQNKPAISFVTQLHTKLSKINEGDLFISSNPTDIELAVKNGAFCIIYDIDVTIIDKEIAWIKVDNINNAIVKLLRFQLALLDKKIYTIDKIRYELLYILNNNNNLLLLDDDIVSNFDKLQTIHNIDMILSFDYKFIQNIAPNYQQFKIKRYNILNLIIHSVFETTFSYKEFYFYKIRLSKIYINHLLSVLEFIGDFDLDINKLKSFKYMQPIFVTKYLHISEYGKSNRFIIANEDEEIYTQQIEFIQQYFKYVNLKIIDGSKQYIYKQIKNNDINILYIINKNIEEVEQILTKNIPKIGKLF